MSKHSGPYRLREETTRQGDRYVSKWAVEHHGLIVDILASKEEAERLVGTLNGLTRIPPVSHRRKKLSRFSVELERLGKGRIKEYWE